MLKLGYSYSAKIIESTYTFRLIDNLNDLRLLNRQALEETSDLKKMNQANNIIFWKKLVT